MDAANLNAFQITPSTNKDTNCCTAIHVFALVVSISCYAPDTTIPSNCNFGYPDVSRQNNHPTKTELTVERRFHQDSDEGHYDTGTGAYAIDCGSIICNPSQCTDHVQRPQFQDINWKAGIAMFEYSTSSMNVSISTSKLRDTKVHPNRDDYSFNGSWEIFSCSQQKEHREDVYFPQRKGRVNFVTPSIDVPSSYATSPVAWELQPLCQGGSARTRKLLGVSINSARSKRQGEDGAIAASGVFGFICFSVGLLLWCMRRNTKVDVELESMLHPQLWRGTGPVRFSYSELVAATSNFAEENQLGRGGFGQVYRGRLVSDQNRQVAVKMFSSESPSQGRKEFEAEVKVMSQLRHRNLVQLVGWCDSPEQLLLVYELASEGSLDKHLYDYGGRLLTWPERYKIALGVGSAVLYLHTECERCVVHGDIKPSNVMLDSSLGSKLGDFGLARLVDHGAEPQTTHVIAGTPGYIDPEFINTQRPSTESDVYSFGVVLMEIASGRRPTATSVQPGEAPALLRRVRDLYDQDAILDAADDRLNGEFDDQQMESVLITGLWCAHPDRSQRPSIAQAMAALRCEDGGLPVLPELHGTGQIRALEEQAYGDLLAEVSGSTRSSAATAYHTPEVSSYLYAVE